MRILILSDDYLPKSVKAHSKMLHELAIKLKSHGHDVNILTPGKKIIQLWALNKNNRWNNSNLL